MLPTSSEENMSHNTALDVKNYDDKGHEKPESVAKDAKVMEVWQHITDYTDLNACYSSPSQWNFRFLEITGQNCETHRNIEEICKRIPKLRIETKTRYVKPRVESKLRIDFKYKPPRKATKSLPKPHKEKIVSIKVLVPKPSDENLSRNCTCTCESPEEIGKRNDIRRSYEEQEEEDDDISFKELLDILFKYDKETHKNGSSNVICNLVKRFQGNSLLNEDEVKRVLKMLDSNNHIVQECLLILINKVTSTSTTAKLFLQNDVLNDLIYLMLMGSTDDVQLQAACCIAKLTEREEFSDLWMEAMAISGTEALFDVLSADEETVFESLRKAILDAVMNLAKNQKMAAMLINGFDLTKIIDLTRCKTDEGKVFGSPAIQKVAMGVLNSLLAHSYDIVEQFISKYSEAVDRVLDILQYSSCSQQQEAARFLSTLTLFPHGIDPVISHHATEHLLWAMTCSHCRFVRENTSKAFKNITQHSDKTKVLSALEQFSIAQIDQPYDSNRELDALRAQPTTTKIISDLQKHTSLSKLEKTMVDIFSVLSISFQTDSLHLCGTSRTFTNDSQGKDARNCQGISTKGVNEQYLSSLRVLVNILVAMATLICLKDRDESEKEIPCSLGNGANLSLAALFVQCGGLQFLNQLRFLTTKLQRVNPPSFHEIDPTTLPPKEIVSSIKNTRSELIFTASGQKRIPKNRYPDFGFHSAEIQFVGQAVEFLNLLVQVTTQDFDPVQEDLNVFIHNRSPPALSKRKHISFLSAALVVRSVIRVNGSISPRGGKEGNDNGNKKRIKRHSSRSLSSRTSHTTMERRSTTTSQVTKSSSSPSVLDPGTSSKNEMIHYVKQSLLAANVVSLLAVWVTCGVYDIQIGVIKVLRYLMHTYNPPKRVCNDQASHNQPQEAWATKTKKASKSTKPSQRSSLTQLNKPKNKSTQLSHLCVRHVIQYCGAYLLDLLEPPATRNLGRLSLMVIREAIVNGENDSRLNFVKLGCLSQVINYIRGTEDEPEIQSLGLVVLRSLVSNNQALKQLFLAHGGMSLVMALYEYKEGLVKEEAACTLKMFSRASADTGNKTKGPTAHSKKRSRTQTTNDDIWDHVTKKWEGQDKVAKVLTKFNVRY
ncbi:uncharacterized protein LOC116308861 [Actinia tenebrosa]|uniref:Uncharacterized protein LOC116308861 n=1 Tax=Actinia tenebrosa TaxID=6105 RepID=A0A6P8J652_ACTTE|nr:uncharacterized protein LOC116308861 [Actinia tenebrosa]